MDKRTATISFRTYDGIERALQAIAMAQEVSVSDLMHRQAVELIERERRAYLKLSAAFANGQDLLGLHDLHDNHV